MNRAQSNQLRETLVGIVVHLQAEIAGLEKRLQQVEQRQAKAMSWAGAWRANKRYREGEITQKGGGLWMCLADTSGATPGASPHWRLVVKAGSFNGKDAR